MSAQARAAEARRAPGRWRRVLGRTLAVSSLAVVVAGLWVRHRLVASLPLLDGERTLAGLSAPVRVDRDGLGVPTIAAASRLDAARALGFLHAQDRFFQMDLLRRRAAGELAELLGPAALPLDRGVRLHRLRARARRALERTTAEERAVLDAYASGASGGLAMLAAPPFEYLVLRSAPLPWRPEDSILAAHAMFLDLNDENAEKEAAFGLMRDTLPPALLAFLLPGGTEWDAPLAGGPVEAPPVPGPEVLDLRSGPARVAALSPAVRGSARLGDEAPGLLDSDVGSNNWAIAGSHTKDGRALLADDMHLGISVPNTWYRASLTWPSVDGGASREQVTGVTLPGTPAVVVGSNGHVAWGFTNSQGDWSDSVVLETDPKHEESYLTPEGPRRLAHLEERIRVRGRPDEAVDVAESIWGPVVGKDHRGRPRVVRWIAHEPDAVDTGLLRVETARSVGEAQRAANRTGAPPQNFVCADSGGHIGWTILGRIPRRVGYTGRYPTSWSDGSRRWDGWLAPEEYPRIVDPPQGRIWTANNRVVEGEMLAKIGEEGFALGARARQIRDDLLAVDRASEADLLAVQLDDRAVFLGRWRELLLQALSERAVAADPRRHELRHFVEAWSGRASVDSVGYRAVRGFRLQVAERVFPPLTSACAKAQPGFRYLDHAWQYEGPLWRLASERPAHLLDPAQPSWDALLLAAADAVIGELVADGARIAERTWGQRNTTAIRHPLSRAAPWLGRFLDMPRLPLPGDSNMPRVQSPSSGASERLGVSPGHEQDGYFHMPGGQSGHPLSEHYRKGFEAWARGEPTPFLPGKAQHTLTLRPAP